MSLGSHAVVVCLRGLGWVPFANARHSLARRIVRKRNTRVSATTQTLIDAKREGQALDAVNDRGGGSESNVRESESES